MKFKELFGSFTGHQIENRSTGMRNGSTGLKKWTKQKTQHLGTVGDGTPIGAVADGLHICPSPRIVRRQQHSPSAETGEAGTVADGASGRRRRLLNIGDPVLFVWGFGTIKTGWWDIISESYTFFEV
ncbi:hypothetical protein Hdeb2414_s0025g00662171 [Helianthus debilis subsp. tardiflorus]